jgi:hypothetical protein
VLDITVPPATYTFTVDVLNGVETIDTSSAKADLTNGTTTQIALAAQAATKGGPASSVQIGVDMAPQITGVEVQASGAPDTSATTSVTIDASDPNGDSLTFFWSGVTLEGTVQGTSTMSFSTAAIQAAAASTAPVLHVVAEDASGTSTAADVTLTVAGAAVQGAMVTSSDSGAALQACLDTQAQCNAACAPGLALGAANVTVNATCLASCSASLASCKLN